MLLGDPQADIGGAGEQGRVGMRADSCGQLRRRVRGAKQRRPSPRVESVVPQRQRASAPAVSGFAGVEAVRRAAMSFIRAAAAMIGP